MLGAEISEDIFWDTYNDLVFKEDVEVSEQLRNDMTNIIFHEITYNIEDEIERSLCLVRT